jgi:hypothetical protein
MPITVCIPIMRPTRTPCGCIPTHSGYIHSHCGSCHAATCGGINIEELHRVCGTQQLHQFVLVWMRHRAPGAPMGPHHKTSLSAVLLSAVPPHPHSHTKPMQQRVTQPIRQQLMFWLLLLLPRTLMWAMLSMFCIRAAWSGAAAAATPSVTAAHSAVLCCWCAHHVLHRCRMVCAAAAVPPCASHQWQLPLQ